MSETVLVAIITTFIGSSVVTALVAAYISRRKRAVDVRKATAEANAIESATRQSEVTYYQERVDATIKQMRKLESQVQELKAYIGEIQNKYEQRVGQLHGEIQGLATELERANRNLDTANETIKELRQEVKEGNKVITGLREEITGLREEITKLLVDRAAKQTDGG